ncbi:uroporphyrinogen-III C-methyltransferase [Cyanobacterium aponinum]|uniref:uroporphyrinogen-III C-methyltransferase n=1 Tax=Cyanobacterium aponinum 0216 TaxID=2676140 RepID=A0A844GSZ6_9CHRO|nr:uroporphyrinogen-III C-methyltransferase [Cyanobacterium aponinum]MTF37395.1 uroporphyrinogen-III C-methyltransferase [Cyanobacterium aponinum 0216]
MTVFFVGAGIGDADHLTVKAHRLISQADVIIYDALIDNQILQLVPENCLQIPVGKRGGKVSTPQETINQLLAQYAPVYKTIIRLKGGDPGIFGRINPEIETLQAINVDYELIPGISSSIAAPLLANIFLTEKENSHGFMVVTGHDPNLLNWQVLSQVDTLVILMGSKNLPIIVDKLQEYGRSHLFPIAIIKQAGNSQQQIWKGTLGNIVEQTVNISLSPCIIVIGKVVR